MKATERWYSARLGRDIGLARWGHYGTPVLVFPTAGGDAEEIERNGLVGACLPLIEAGRIKLYSCDSVAGRAMLEKEGSPEHRMELVDRFHQCVVSEVVPAVRADQGASRSRSSPPAPRSGPSTPSPCSAGSPTCSAPPSA